MARTAYVLMLAAGLLAAAVTGCSGAESSASRGVVVVTIDNLRFQPAEVTIDPGTTVRWVNEDTTAHTSTSKDFKMGGPNPPTAWNSTPLNQDQSWEHTFNTSGDFDYFCMVHPYMKGVVHVRGAR